MDGNYISLWKIKISVRTRDFYIKTPRGASKFIHK